MIGLAASSGTEVDPMCSSRCTRSSSTARIRIAEITIFDTVLFPAFGLPPTL